MNRLKLIVAVLLALVGTVSAQVIITNLSVTSQTATSAQISWNTSGPASTQVLFGINGILNSNTVKDPSLVTSHTATISGIFSGAVFSYAAVSVDAGAHTTQSPTQTFELCTRSGYTQVSGTVNNYYEYGGYSIAWVNNSGQSITPTVCGQPIQTALTGALDPAGSFNVPVADNLQIVPSPSQWQVTINGTGGIGPYTNPAQTMTGPSVNISATLSSGASGKASHLFCDQSTNTLFPTACGIGGGGGGGGSVGPGTVSHISRFISPSNVGDGVCTDDGVTPMNCAAGLNVATNALFATKPNNGSTGTTANLLIARDASGNAINAQSTDTNNVIGIAGFGAGLTGSVSFAYSGNFACQFDNQTAVGDWVVLGSGSQCHDAGASEPAGIENIGRVSSINSGAGTLAGVDLGLPDSTNTSAGGGTGVVSPASCTGPLGYFQAPGNTITGDCHTSNDGAGNIGVASVTTTGSSSGFISFGQGAAPTLSSVNSAYLYAPTTVATSFGTALPGVPGTLGQILSVGSVPDSTHIITQWIDAISPASCNASAQFGATMGDKINACDTLLGATPGVIYAGPGDLGGGVVISSTHTLHLFPGTYTNSLGNRTPAIRLQDHTLLECESLATILEQSSNSGQSTPVTVAAYNTGPTVNTITATTADIQVRTCHFTQGSTTNNSPFVGIVTLGNCVNCKFNNNFFDQVKSIGLLIGGTSTTGNFADTVEAAGNVWTGGGVNVPLAVINGKNLLIHHNVFRNPGAGAAAPIDIEPNATTDYAENIDLSNNLIDASAATTTTYGITVQGTPGPHVLQHIKIHDNIIYGAPLASGVLMNQAIAIGAGNANTFNDLEVYNNYIYKASADGIALNGVNRAWVHDNHFFCINTIQGAGIPSVIQLSGNDTNNLIERNYDVNDSGCPGINSTNAYGESGSGNANNTFRFNVAPFPTVVSGSGSTQNDPSNIIGLPTSGSQVVGNGTGFIPQTKAIADVADSAVVADGTTDVCTTFQAFIDAHPGRRLLVRKVGAATQGGGQASTIDYYSTCTLHLKFNGTIIEGTAGGFWQGAPVFLFAANTTGFMIDSTCYGCGLVNLEIAGGGKPYPATGACYNSSNALTFPFTGAADGVLIYGGEPHIDNVVSECFPRDGFHIDGTNVTMSGIVGQPDLWRTNSASAFSNQHDGFSIHGGDSNAGVDNGFSAVGSGGWAIEDNSQLGNVHLDNHSNGNGRDAGVAPLTTSNISSISCSGNICSVVAASPVAGIASGVWVVIAGTTNYNGVFFTASNSDSTHFTYNQVAASVASETVGTVGVDGTTDMFANATRYVTDAACPSGQANVTSQNAQFGKDTQAGAAINLAGAGAAGALLTTAVSAVVNEYTITLSTNCLTSVTNAAMSYSGGISGGAYFSAISAATNTWLNPYMESNQRKAKFTSGNWVLGTNAFNFFDYNYGIPQVFGINGVINTVGWTWQNPTDTSLLMLLKAGATSDQVTGFDLCDRNAANCWKIHRTTSGTFSIFDLTAGGQQVFNCNNNTPNGGACALTASGSGALSIQDGSSGNVNFFGPTTVPKVINGGGFYQGSTSVPAFQLNTVGTHFEDIYTTGANCFGFGGSSSQTALPGSPFATFCETGTTVTQPITSSLATGTAPLVISSTTPVANLTVSNHPLLQACGTSAACSHTVTTGGQIVFGSVALSSGTPSTATVTGISPAFTSSSSYKCTLTEETTAANGVKITYVSGSSFTITGPNTVTDVIDYQCAGN